LFVGLSTRRLKTRQRAHPTGLGLIDSFMSPLKDARSVWGHVARTCDAVIGAEVVLT
jgi:hypothetical protein